MPDHYALADRLARAWCEVVFEKRALLAAARAVLGHLSWLPALVGRVRRAFPAGHGLRVSAVRRFLLADPRFVERIGGGSAVQSPEADSTLAPAAPAFAAVPFPPFASVGQLAEWLGLSLGELEWFANLRGWPAGRDGPLAHYRCRWFRKRTSGVRLIESPKPRLKAIQRRILAEILNLAPPHEAAHGFRAGRDVASFTRDHCGRAAVLRLDLADFFPSIRRPRVAGLFTTLGYSPSVAGMLAGLCTHATPSDVWDDFPADAPRKLARETERLYQSPHLPQGAPTSPALANLCAYRLDLRLSGLSRAMGATYTRYADDLLFSGDETFSHGALRAVPRIGAIAIEEGFAVQFRKTRLMRQGVRQRAGGLVLNEHPNVARADYDQLKAILTNCLRRGPALQNRAGHANFRAHLLGRIGHLARFHPARGMKLAELFARIRWG